MMTEWMRGNELEMRRAGGDLGGTMRLGAYEAVLEPGQQGRRDLWIDAHLGAPPPSLRGEHPLQGAPGERPACGFPACRPTGFCRRSSKCRTIRWFIGVQYHPELKSRPFEPHPLFASFIAAAVEQSRLV